LERRGDGDVEATSEVEDEVVDKLNDENADPMMRLISYLRNRGSAKVEVSCYDGSLKAKNLID